jgi:hypothetical protein
VEKSFDYEVRRYGAMWLPLIAVVWANLLTASERDAFTAIAKQFFQDAEPVFGKAG